MKASVEQALLELIERLFNAQLDLQLTRPDPRFGDYTTNVALRLAGTVQQAPRQVAEAIVADLEAQSIDWLHDVQIAGPGFINLTLTDAALLSQLESLQPTQTYANKIVVAEYSDPNPFKVLHAGHFYTSVVGDAIANLVAAAGAEVHRVNFGGDVGMHVGKTMWAIIDELKSESPELLQTVPSDKRSEWLAAAYVRGNNLYEDNADIKAEMVALNKRIYDIVNTDDHTSDLAQLYWTCRQWSYDYFDAFYERIATQFEKYYPESQTAAIGLATVKEHIGSVFSESDGAIVFKGEDYGLHTRVFINNQGIPTYEAKDVGLIIKKQEDYKFDESIIITGNEQAQYMAVVLKAIEQFAPELAQATTHRTHGIVKLAGNVKMSSRRGNILRAVDVLDAAAEANQVATGKDDPAVVLGAIKYAFLKNRLGGDIIYDPADSVALEGNSGPYLQYALVRARSIQRKAIEAASTPTDLDVAERQLVLKLSQYVETVDLAVAEYFPHHICGYLYELAQVFNRFYEQSRVLDDPRTPQRLALLGIYADVLQNGLSLLGIPAPESM